MPSLKLSNPFRRGADRPSLKQRAASLKASAARLMGRKPAEAGADQGRRMMVAGSMAAVVAAPLPVLASAVIPMSEAGSHPDQALFDAETAYFAALDAETAAKAAHMETSAAYSAALGDLPTDLLFPAWAASATAHPGMPLWKYQIQRRMVDTQDGEIAYRWTANGLKRAIAALPEAFGRAGRTPHTIRELRALIPVAETYEARKAELQRRFGTAETMHAWSEAQTSKRQAMMTIAGAVAATPAGLAVKVRQMSEGDTWHKKGIGWEGLFRSAALIAGVTLVDPDASYDAAGWVQAWEALGGRALPGKPGFPPNFHCPRTTSPEHAALIKPEITRLIAELDDHRRIIERHVQGRG